MSLDLVTTLINEYLADANCRPELWIASENVTPEEKSRFLSIIKDHLAAKESIASYNSPHS